MFQLMHIQSAFRPQHVIGGTNLSILSRDLDPNPLRLPPDPRNHPFPGYNHARIGEAVVNKERPPAKAGAHL
jgi:hypothetical protein